MEDKNIYVEIESSTSVRRDILEDASDSLHLLKQFEENTISFEQEEALYRKFKNKMTALKSSITKFGNLLPEINKEEEPKKESIKKLIVKTPKLKTESDILKDQIDDIEQKLKNL